jgi:hypothetical protein
MTNPSAPDQFAGPGLTRKTYLDLLTTTGATGWHDEHGVPAPWPDDFLDPHSGWQPTTGGDTTSTDPNQPL